MASIRKRGSKWQVQVRRSGQSPLSQTFHRRSDAETWARRMEVEADRGDAPATAHELKKVTLGDVLTRYRDEITPRKRGTLQETARLRRLLDHPISRKPLSALKATHVSELRDERLQTCQPETVIRELTILRHALEVARVDWGLPLRTNPVTEIRKPDRARPRDRRLQPGEYEALMAAAGHLRSPIMRHVIILAVETGMRRSELTNLSREDVDLESRCVTIRISA